MTKKEIMAALMAVTIFLNLISPVGAASIQDKQAELESIQQQLYNKDMEREKAKQVVASATDRLIEAQSQLSVAQNELATVEEEREDLEQQIDSNTVAIDKKKEQVKQRVNVYRGRLRDIYINGQINYLDVLLGAKDFSDFSSRMYLLKRVIASDISLLEDLKKKRAELEANQEILESNMAKIKVVHSEVSSKQQVVAQKTSEREAAYNDALAEQERLDEEYNELMATSERIANMIRNLESGGTISSSSIVSSGYAWPIAGEITSPFGWRVHPVFGTEKFHTGIDIAADYGDPIVAANSGTVIYADWMGGYGNAVMIDHGGGIVTLYGHNSSLAVYDGQQVAKGQIIAYAGSTGYSTGPHCHFEVRIHGEVTDPLDYLP
ncbi:MAG: peptidase M23 [Negativicutes bacterium]|nr:peptidase M23 [Negativicutes bacterium]